MSEQANIWDRQPGESAQAYQAARAYFEMGADRSLAAVGRKLGKSTALMERWSSRHNWSGRAAAYDAYMLAIEQQERERVRRAEAAKWERRRAEQREREWSLSERLAERAAQMLEYPIERQETRTVTERPPE